MQLRQLSANKLINASQHTAALDRQFFNEIHYYRFLGVPYARPKGSMRRCFAKYPIFIENQLPKEIINELYASFMRRRDKVANLTALTPGRILEMNYVLDDQFEIDVTRTLCHIALETIKESDSKKWDIDPRDLLRIALHGNAGEECWQVILKAIPSNIWLILAMDFFAGMVEKGNIKACVWIWQHTQPGDQQELVTIQASLQPRRPKVDLLEKAAMINADLLGWLMDRINALQLPVIPTDIYRNFFLTMLSRNNLALADCIYSRGTVAQKAFYSEGITQEIFFDILRWSHYMPMVQWLQTILSDDRLIDLDNAIIDNVTNFTRAFSCDVERCQSIWPMLSEEEKLRACQIISGRKLTACSTSDAVLQFIWPDICNANVIDSLVDLYAHHNLQTCKLVWQQAAPAEKKHFVESLPLPVSMATLDWYMELKGSGLSTYGIFLEIYNSTSITREFQDEALNYLFPLLTDEEVKAFINAYFSLPGDFRVLLKEFRLDFCEIIWTHFTTKVQGSLIGAYQRYGAMGHSSSFEQFWLWSHTSEDPFQLSLIMSGDYQLLNYVLVSGSVADFEMIWAGLQKSLENEFYYKKICQVIATQITGIVLAGKLELFKSIWSKATEFFQDVYLSNIPLNAIKKLSAGSKQKQAMATYLIKLQQTMLTPEPQLGLQAHSMWQSDERDAAEPEPKFAKLKL